MRLADKSHDASRSVDPLACSSDISRSSLVAGFALRRWLKSAGWMMVVLGICCIAGVVLLMAVMFVPDDLTEEQVMQLRLHSAEVPKPAPDPYSMCYLLTLGLAESHVGVFGKSNDTHQTQFLPVDRGP